MLLNILADITNFATSLMRDWGWLGILVLMAIESACIPIPSEVIMPFAGYLVSKNDMTLLTATISGTLGCLIGSIIAYLVGAKGGRPLLLKYGKYILITPQKLDYVDSFFDKHGEKAIFWSRVLPIVRTFISLPAGITKMNFSKFALFSAAGSLPWCFVLSFVGYKLGKNWEDIKSVFHYLDAAVAVAIIVCVIYLIKRFKTKKVKNN